MRSKRALAILTSLVLAIGTLSVSTFAADNSATAPTSSAAEDACANGHDYELKNEVGPTCTEDGYREEVCSRCGDTRRVDGEKALGHDFSGEGRVTREATADREGELTFTCLRDDCNETKTEKIPKLEKTAEDTDAAPASSNQNQQDQNQADQTSQQESAAQNAGQTQKGEAAQNATLSIAGIPVPQEKGTIKAGESKIKFKREGEGNKEEITLTFDDSTLEVNGSSKKQPPEAVIAYTGTGTLNISIEGENAVTGKNSSYGVYAPDGTVKLTGKKGATLDIQAASENSNTIRAKKIVVDDSLEITGPENNYVFEGSNGMGGTYQTIAVANNGRNMAVSKVTIRDPNASDDKKDAEEKKEENEETKDDENKTAEESNDQKDDKSDENGQKDETVTENKEENNTEETQKQDDENKTADEPAQNAAASTRRKLGTASKLLGEAPQKSFELSINGTKVTSANDSAEAGSGTIKYEISTDDETGNETVSLTLDKAELTSEADAAISYLGKGEVIITLKGENKITGADHAIYAPYAKLTIKGTKEDSLKAATVNKAPAPAAIIANTISVDDPLEIAEPENNKIGTRDEYVTSASETVTCNTITDVNASGHAAISVTIKAPAEYTITFDKNGGTGEMADVSHKENAGDYELPACDFTGPDGAGFDQWEVNDTKYNAGDKIPVTDNVTVKALWKDIEFTVTYESNGGTGDMESATVKKADGKLKLPKCDFQAPDDNKEFDQWQVGTEKYDAGKEIEITDNTTVTALWKDIEFTVTYESNGGTGDMKSATVKKADGKLELPKCAFKAPANKDFDQWQVGTKKYDAGKEIEITDNTTVTALWKTHTHNWKDSTYSWANNNSVTATRICKTNSSHVETETVTTTKTTTATCEKAGKNTYTATFNNTAFKDQTKTEDQPALGHNWGAPVFTWSKDYAKATATRTCTHDKSHTESKDAKVTGMITVPTDKVAGKIEYTATVTFDGKTFTDVKSKPIAKAGTKGYNFTVKPNAWVKNSRNSLGFTVKRSSYDAMTFAAFDKITVDGKTVENKNNTAYTTEKGSLKLTFKPAYLNSLSAGSHTLKIFFKDGSVETTFNVQTTSATGNGTAARTTNATTNRTANATTNRTATGSPTTGDTSNWPLWIGLLAASAAAICGIVFVRRRSKQNEAGAGEEED